MSNFKMKCDYCKIEYNYSEKNIFHCTAIVDGELNPHTHLCYNCFRKVGIPIPLINTKLNKESKENNEKDNWDRLVRFK